MSAQELNRAAVRRRWRKQALCSREDYNKRKNILTMEQQEEAKMLLAEGNSERVIIDRMLVEHRGITRYRIRYFFCTLKHDRDSHAELKGDILVRL